MRQLLRPVVWLVIVGCAFGGGDAKLWELGDQVEANPLTVFTMFCGVILVTVGVELAKHHFEHKHAHDPYKMAGLEAIYVELMLVGVVSFALILAAELGLTDIRIGSCDDSSVGSAASSTGSSSAECGYGFDLLLFEYAHLVLFTMGLAYCAYVQICFYWRTIIWDMMHELQQYTLPSWKILELKTGRSKCSFARKVLLIRSAMALRHERKMRYICREEVGHHTRALHEIDGQDHPNLPKPDACKGSLDMGKYVYIMFSEVVIQLLHVPNWVWVVVPFGAGINLLNMVGVDLAWMLIVMSTIGPAGSFFFWWRMESRLSSLVNQIERIPGVYDVPCYGSTPHPDTDAEATFTPAFKNTKPDLDPWQVIEDESIWKPSFIKPALQVLVYWTCFYVGQLVLLSSLTADHLGYLVLVMAYLAPLVPLCYFIPQTLLLYVLIYQTRRPPQRLLQLVLEKRPPPGVLAEHHGGHGKKGDDHKDKGAKAAKTAKTKVAEAKPKAPLPPKKVKSSPKFDPRSTPYDSESSIAVSLLEHESSDFSPNPLQRYMINQWGTSDDGFVPDIELEEDPIPPLPPAHRYGR
eukprot:TRINITY_DN15109_c0_g2_i1.p1 TRINITY_DN15109_c0_g2~~TRINITY_DN15109_c0_g2_i1.p1  ORF type:complete len:578 (+),score=87.25 TRINITY_DN15109_c0_g2_i1:1766-3499(+)